MTEMEPGPPQPSGTGRPSGSADRVQAAVRAEARRWRRLFLLIVLLIGLTFAAMVSHGVFGAVPRPAIPEELLGIWTTDNPRYAGRELVFDSNLVTIGTGDGRLEVYPVYDLRRQAGVGVQRFLITYLMGRTEVTLTVVHRPEQPGVIELSNPAGVRWRRR